MQDRVLYGCRMSARRLRVTMVILDVLDVLMNAPPDAPAWGLRLCEQTGHGTGTIYPALDRMLPAHWIDDSWEEPRAADRPRRRYYTVTVEGRAAYHEVVAARSARRAAWAWPGLRAGETV
jgi:PadR family transcriptional regulator, regulatory protein PadR